MMDNPQVKAQRDKQRVQEKSLEDESYAVVMKNLYPRQRATLKKMVGTPFDRSVMGGGMFGRGPGGATTTGAATTAKTANAKSTADDDDDDEKAPAPAAKAKTPAPAKAAASPTRKKSLRELRGGDDDE